MDGNASHAHSNPWVTSKKTGRFVTRDKAGREGPKSGIKLRASRGRRNSKRMVRKSARDASSTVRIVVIIVVF